MSEHRNGKIASDRLVPCPECGGSFSPRGIATHRRLRHGTAAHADLRAVLESLSSLRLVLESLSDVLGRVDERLDRIEASRAPASEGAPDAKALERGIDEVLGEIGRVKSETDRQLAEWGGRPRTDEERVLEQTAFTRIATLRKRQASLVYRLREMHAAQAADAACL